MKLNHQSSGAHGECAEAGNFRRLPVFPAPLRVITWIVVATQMWAPFSNQLFAAVESLQERSAATAQRSGSPADRTTPALVAVNRMAPQLERPPATAKFSRNPTDEEFFRARVFAEPLVPTGKSSAEENRALANALTTFLARKSNDEVQAITQFLAQFPNSVWRLSLLTDLGIVYRKTGYFSRAMEAWEEAWAIGSKQTEGNPKAIADRAVAELVELNARVGRFDRLETLFTELDGWTFHGSATEKIAGAKEGLWLMRNKPEKAFRCGPMALDRIRAMKSLNDAFDPKIVNSRSTLQGMSLVEVRDLANDLKMDYQMAKRSPGAKVIVPSVVHWKLGHYAALVKERNGRYLVQDPTFTDELWVSAAALDDEASGYFLIGSGPLLPGWRSVASEEGKVVYGKGNTATKDQNRDKETDVKAPPPPPKTPCPMAVYAGHAMLVSLNIVDTPVGYAPPRGPQVAFKVTYNQREANQPSIFTYSNLGPKWTLDWLSYIADDPNIEGASGIPCFLQGGGAEVLSGYDVGTASYVADKESHAVVVRISSSSYERRLPDGSKQIYDQPDGASAFPRKVFLTKETDPAGNAVTYTYDANLRITAVTDAIGQVTTVAYALGADSSKITKVTDPFGRFATFDYTQVGGVWQLTKITDVIGVTSEFTYSGDFITSLKTPYGTSSFAYGESGTTRWLEATDPLGQTERVEYRDIAPGIAFSDEQVPAGMSPIVNAYLYYRNSFYWDKKAFKEANGDYTKAHMYHFQHTVDLNSTSGILESDKKALESRVWRNYPGAPPAYGDSVEGTNALPLRVGRLLDSNVTQRVQFEYNAYGNVTRFTDALGRATTNIFAANLVDLLEVRQVVGANQETLARFTYNSQHLPLTAIDPAGRTNWFAYSTNGQLKAVTNALGQTVSMSYNTNGYLTNITGAVTGAVTGFTYDGYGRVRTVTDSEGYTVTMDYDAMDRPTKITYPDATFEQIVYHLLDPVLQKDRRGHWTSTTYDQLRRVTDVEDSLNRITHFEWCGCGSLGSITDPLGRVTSWIRDLQGRVLTKVYPDNSSVNYAYETNSSRLKSVTDAKNQTTRYSYFADDNLQQVSYSNAVVATPSVSFTYDTNYNRILTRVDGIGTNNYAYNSMTNGLPGAGRLATVDGSLPNDTISYQYDDLGRVTNRAIDSVAQRVVYDSLGRMTVVTNVLGSFTNSYVNATFRLSSVAYPNGQSTILTYFGNSGDQRLQQIQHSTINTQLSTFSYTYDADGQIKTWTQQADNGTPTVQVLEYDPVDQLLASTVRSNGITGAILKQFVYGYDKTGNRTSEQIGSGVTKANHNNLNQLTNTVGGGPIRFAGRISEPGNVLVGSKAAAMNIQNTSFVAYAEAALGTNVVPVTATDYSNNSATNNYQIVVTNGSVAKTITYDLNGNLVSAITATSTNQYAWDAANRLVGITNGTHVSEFTYDGLSRRVRIVEKDNGSTTSDKRFIWCSTELCEERDSTGATVTRRFFGQGEQIMGANYFFSRDHLGSVREMTDGSGTIRARYDYDPYGRRTKASGDLEADFGFTGHYSHSQTGLNLALYRTYDSDACRWLTRDPVKERGGINLYEYVRSNPSRIVDRLGLYGDETKFWADLSVSGNWLERAAAWPMGIIAATIPDAMGVGPSGTVGFIGGGTVGVQEVRFRNGECADYSFVGYTRGPDDGGFVTPQVSVGISVTFGWSSEYNPGASSWLGAFTEDNVSVGPYSFSAGSSDTWKTIGLGASVGPVPLSASHFDKVDYQYLGK